METTKNASDLSNLHFPPTDIVLKVDSFKVDWVKFDEVPRLGTMCKAWTLKFENRISRDLFLEMVVYYSLERDKNNDFVFTQYTTPMDRFDLELDLVMTVNGVDEEGEPIVLEDWTDYEVTNARKVAMLLERIDSLANQFELRPGLRLNSSEIEDI